MTENQGDHSVPEDQSQQVPTTGEPVASDVETETEAPPEPWTAERVTEWNNYFDVYVMLAALLLIFVASCNYVTDCASLAAFANRAGHRRPDGARDDRHLLLHTER